MATATLPPATQASGWRAQKPRASDTAALARFMASLASILASGDVDFAPLGSSTQTTPSQKVIRNRKNMTLPTYSPAAFSPPLN
jgi:predicted lipoprotein with Yx(FWY)xxD motif